MTNCNAGANSENILSTIHTGGMRQYENSPIYEQHVTASTVGLPKQMG